MGSRNDQQKSSSWSWITSDIHLTCHKCLPSGECELQCNKPCRLCYLTKTLSSIGDPKAHEFPVQKSGNRPTCEANSRHAQIDACILEHKNSFAPSLSYKWRQNQSMHECHNLSLDQNLEENDWCLSNLPSMTIYDCKQAKCLTSYKLRYFEEFLCKA